MEIILARIAYGYKQSNVYVNIKETRIALLLLDLLLNEGLILRYKTIPYTNRIQVYLKYNNLKVPVIKLLANISKTKKKKFIKSSQLKSLVYRHPLSIFFLATTGGFITQKKALKFNIAGKLICKID
jgi:ribosomal protein S8